MISFCCLDFGLVICEQHLFDRSKLFPNLHSTIPVRTVAINPLFIQLCGPSAQPCSYHTVISWQPSWKKVGNKLVITMKVLYAKYQQDSYPPPPLDSRNSQKCVSFTDAYHLDLHSAKEPGEVSKITTFSGDSWHKCSLNRVYLQPLPKWTREQLEYDLPLRVGQPEGRY